MVNFERKTCHKIIQNLAWTVGYNVIAIPLTAGMLCAYFMLSPQWV
ncbi:hypothetical protein [Ilyomonas limi]|nr:hypothetical protein [Ilyomonas limi]